MIGSCKCGTTWGGTKTEHCPACHETFTGSYSGDKHRVGKHHISTGPQRRRCLNESEMLDIGMVQNSKRVWMSQAREDAA